MPKPEQERAHETCVCGRHWYGPHGTNPSLKCDVCYPPADFGPQSFESCTGCMTCTEHFDECVVED